MVICLFVKKKKMILDVFSRAASCGSKQKRTDKEKLLKQATDSSLKVQQKKDSEGPGQKGTVNFAQHQLTNFSSQGLTSTRTWKADDRLFLESDLETSALWLSTCPSATLWPPLLSLTLGLHHRLWRTCGSACRVSSPNLQACGWGWMPSVEQSKQREL